MKVLIVQPNMDLYGGAEHLIVKLCNHLYTHNISNTILTTSINPHIKQDLHKTSIIFSPKPLITSPKILSHILMAYNLRKTIKKHISQYDIINLHNFPSQLSSFNLNKPTIWMCNEPTSLNLNKSTLSTLFLKLERHIVQHHITSSIVADNYNKNRFQKIYNATPMIINYGIECGAVDDLIKDPTHYNVIQVGNITPYKNQKTSILAVEQIIKYIPLIKLTLVGDDNSTYAQNLKKYVQDNNLTNYIKFTGNLSRSEVKHLYSQSHLAIFPTKFQGGWLSPFEAICANLPIIVSRSTPCANIIQENNLGVVTNNFRTAILSSYASSNIDTQANKNWVRNNLTWSKFGDKTIKLFKGELPK